MREPDTYPVAWPEFRLSPETGAMELAVAEWAAAHAARPQKVTAILAATLSEVDGKAARPDLLRRLSVGTREWLLQQVAALCRPADDWHEIQCPSCGGFHDTTIDLAAMPRSTAPAAFPLARIGTGPDSLLFEVPNGRHEDLVSQRPDAPLSDFLAACALNDDTRAVLAQNDVETLARIEAELDEATPETADLVSSDCPDCNAPCQARVDPLTYAFPQARGVLRDVHMLSSTYKWSEEAVLAMPLHRRKTYVGMISAATGAA